MKISRQSWTKYLKIFSRFSTISLQHSWSGTKLLLPHPEYTSHRATSHFNWEIRKFVNFNKISEMRIGRNSAYTVRFQKYTHQDFTRNLGKETCWRDATPSSFVICIILCMTASLLLLWFNSCCFHCTKMKFSIKDFFSKREQIRSFLQIWLHLLRKSWMENFIFCAVFRGKQLNY